MEDKIHVPCNVTLLYQEIYGDDEMALGVNAVFLLLSFTANITLLSPF